MHDDLLMRFGPAHRRAPAGRIDLRLRPLLLYVAATLVVSVLPRRPERVQGRYAERVLLGLHLFEFGPLSVGVCLAARLAVGLRQEEGHIGARRHLADGILPPPYTAVIV